MLVPHIERILTQLPGWNAAEARVSPLEGGITNKWSDPESVDRFH